jgi:hypothetical protein
MRHRSNSMCIQSGMLHQLLNLFKLPTSRSDIVVMLYRRVTDWIGLQRRLQNWLSQEVFASTVEARIGFSVAFDDFSLVGYYDLQLAVADHRSFLKRVLVLRVCNTSHAGMRARRPCQPRLRMRCPVRRLAKVGSERRFGRARVAPPHSRCPSGARRASAHRARCAWRLPRAGRGRTARPPKRQ